MSSKAANADHQLRVDGRLITLKRLDKVLYPETQTTKADVLDYYARVAPVLLPHLAGRPVTRIRWPDGTGSHPFFEKNVPSYAPDWLPTIELASPGSTRDRETLLYPLFNDTAALIWSANLAALELHVPQWRIENVNTPDRLVIDLDPGDPAGLTECADVAQLIRTRLTDDGLDAVPVTSGSKGMQLYVKIAGTQAADVVNRYARALAESMARDHRDLVVSKMAKNLRPGKVLLDWSQNNTAKTTISPYSLRGRAQPWVAAPRTWDEITPALVQLGHTQVLERIEESGDHARQLLEPGRELPEH